MAQDKKVSMLRVTLMIIMTNTLNNVNIFNQELVESIIRSLIIHPSNISMESDISSSSTIMRRHLSKKVNLSQIFHSLVGNYSAVFSFYLNFTCDRDFSLVHYIYLIRQII